MNFEKIGNSNSTAEAVLRHEVSKLHLHNLRIQILLRKRYWDIKKIFWCTVIILNSNSTAEAVLRLLLIILIWQGIILNSNSTAEAVLRHIFQENGNSLRWRIQILLRKRYWDRFSIFAYNFRIEFKFYCGSGIETLLVISII